MTTGNGGYIAENAVEVVSAFMTGSSTAVPFANAVKGQSIRV